MFKTNWIQSPGSYTSDRGVSIDGHLAVAGFSTTFILAVDSKINGIGHPRNRPITVDFV